MAENKAKLHTNCTRNYTRDFYIIFIAVVLQKCLTAMKQMGQRSTASGPFLPNFKVTRE